MYPVVFKDNHKALDLGNQLIYIYQEENILPLNITASMIK